MIQILGNCGALHMNREQIINGIHKGIASAHSKYEKWSEGYWLSDSGVEGFLVSEIAANLQSGRKDGGSLLMEARFSEIVDDDGLNRNRADIVLFDRLGRSTCVIEVKRGWSSGAWGVRKDLTRLHNLLAVANEQNNSAVRRGFLAMYLARQVGGRRMSLQERMTSIVDVAKQHVGSDVRLRVVKSNVREKSFQEEDGLYYPWQWGSLSIEVTLPQ